MIEGLWTAPLTSDRRSSAVPPGPWVYGFTGVGVRYRANPSALKNVVPRPLEPADDGEVFAYVVEIVSQSLSDVKWNLELPDAVQYHEAAFFVKVLYGGRTYAYCPYMWVDTDLSLLRGFLAGFPKKLARISYTKLHPLLHGEPRRGLKLGGFAARSHYTLFRIAVELEEDRSQNEIPLRSMGPMLLPRYFPAIAPGLTEVNELVVFKYDSRCLSWRGRGSIEVVGGPNDVLKYLEPAGDSCEGYYFHLYLKPVKLSTLTSIKGFKE
ncbi:MAG: acetoacetate decarboxylase [Thermoprotei archaeon]|nr:MAG: acetoacetate decarboxylase [Thermoprotei archaeon]